MTREEALNKAIGVLTYHQVNFCKSKEAVANMNKIIEALEKIDQEPCTDAVSRQAIFDGLASIAKTKAKSDAQKSLMGRVMFFVKELPSVTPMQKWIPITSRPMTEEEKEHYKTHPEYQDDYRIFNCKLPDDGQEVLISVYGGVEVDTFVQDANDGCYFEGRDIDDVDAWMPLPKPYQPEIPTGQIVTNGELYPGEFDDPLAEEGSEE